MAYRTFRDGTGRKWDVWTVIPTKVERRSVAQEVGVERRRSTEPRVRLADAMAEGWLCFQTRDEKRRLAPYPVQWHAMTDDELASLCTEAERAPAPRRLVE